MQVYTIVHILYNNSDLKNYLSIKDLVLTVTAITSIPYCWIFKCKGPVKILINYSLYTLAFSSIIINY